MHSSGSYLLTVVDQIRRNTDEPDIDGRYSTNDIVSSVVMPALQDVLSRINNSSQRKILLTHDVTLTADQDYYRLPHFIRSVQAMGAVNDNRLQNFFEPRHLKHAYGRQWAIEGNELFVESDQLLGATTIRLFFVPTGDLRMAYFASSNSEVTLAKGSDDTSIEMSFTGDTVRTVPTFGTLDFRDQAHAGSYFRVLSDGSAGQPGGYEYLIKDSGYESPNLVFDFRREVTETVASSGSQFEIVPEILPVFMEPVSWWGAIKLKSRGGGMSRRREQQMMLQYKSSMKTAIDLAYNINASVPPAMRLDAATSPDYGKMTGSRPVG